jgi:hypothetical protein
MFKNSARVRWIEILLGSVVSALLLFWLVGNQLETYAFESKRIIKDVMRNSSDCCVVIIEFIALLVEYDHLWIWRWRRIDGWNFWWSITPYHHIRITVLYHPLWTLRQSKSHSHSSGCDSRKTVWIEGARYPGKDYFSVLWRKKESAIGTCDSGW